MDVAPAPYPSTWQDGHTTVPAGLQAVSSLAQQAAEPGQAVPGHIPSHAGALGSSISSSSTTSSRSHQEQETSRTLPWATAAADRAASLPVLSRQGMNPDQHWCFKSSCFPVKTLTVAVWQRLLLLLTKQSWDFSREAADAECVKLLHQPERGLHTNICTFVLLLQL